MQRKTDPAFESSSSLGDIAMIRVTLKGGLGNQMFQYATAHALAKRHGSSVNVDRSAYRLLPDRNHFELWRFERLRLRPVSLYDALVFQARQPLGKRAKSTFSMDGLGFDARVLDLPDGSHIDGWFQSVRYFESALSDIYFLFDLTPFTVEHTVRSVQRLRENGELVSIHVRRGDYIGMELFAVDLESYYSSAIECISKNRRCHFLVFSDDLSWCRAQTIFQSNRVTFFNQLGSRANIPLNEMALMASCDHNIICNSTFSWWAAWLNKNPRRTVIMPRQWLSRYSTDVCGLSVQGWMQL
jgi:hypothetical protein